MREFGLIGYPLAHSFSKKYFDEKFEKEHIKDTSFHNFQLDDIDQFTNLLANHSQLAGLAVTIPYKKNVVNYLDEVSDVVKQTGACNCITIQRGFKKGYNTDVVGFEQSFKKKLLPHHNKALVLGTGGAAAAIEFVLKNISVSFRFVSRNKNENAFSWQEITKQVLDEYTVIINCTPLGTYPNVEDKPLIPYKFLTSEHYLFDLVYNPELTAFLKEGKIKGCTIKNGYEMLVLQAEENWRLWNNA